MTEGADWTQDENRAIVASYLRMLKDELAGAPYVKAHEIERLRESGLDRTPGAIEYKYQNISAVLAQNGWIYIDGYRPAHNFQKSLRDEVFRQLIENPDLDNLMKLRVQQLTEAAIVALKAERQLKVVNAPHIDPNPAPPEPWSPPGAGLKRDYTLRDAKNRELGLEGEKLVVEFERRRLRDLGRPELAEQVAHVALDLGDGLGYDVRSFEADGEERFIEVKTTTRNIQTPFFVSRNEYDASHYYRESYFLYRLFGFGKESQGMYVLRGPLSETCRLTPDTYVALPRPHDPPINS